PLPATLSDSYSAAAPSRQSACYYSGSRGDAMNQNQFDQLLSRAEQLLTRVENLLPPAPPVPDWNRAQAFRWRKQGGRGYLEAIANPHRIRLEDLRNIDRQKALVDRNTRQFVQG